MLAGRLATGGWDSGDDFRMKKVGQRQKGVDGGEGERKRNAMGVSSNIDADT